MLLETPKALIQQLIPQEGLIESLGITLILAISIEVVEGLFQFSKFGLGTLRIPEDI